MDIRSETPPDSLEPLDVVMVDAGMIHQENAFTETTTDPATSTQNLGLTNSEELPTIKDDVKPSPDKNTTYRHECPTLKDASFADKQQKSGATVSSYIYAQPNVPKLFHSWLYYLDVEKIERVPNGTKIITRGKKSKTYNGRPVGSYKTFMRSHPNEKRFPLTFK